MRLRPVSRQKTKRTCKITSRPITTTCFDLEGVGGGGLTAYPYPFCLALDPKIHSKTANLTCWSRLLMTRPTKNTYSETIQNLHFITSCFWPFLTAIDPKTPSWTFYSSDPIRIFTRHVTYNQQSRTHQLAFWSVCHFIHPTKIFVFFNFVLGSIWQ